MAVRQTHRCGFDRRAFLLGTTALAVAATGGLASEAPLQPQRSSPEPFSFDLLTDAVRKRAAEPDPVPAKLDLLLADLTYEDYQLIQFRQALARWRDGGSTWRLMPFHLGWLFREPVHILEVADGLATEMTFSAADFDYRREAGRKVPAGYPLPGVAGFKLTHPLNNADKGDEVISFLGASYFRALGLGNTYGSSARGLAIDSGLPKAEEFPRFTAFWIDRPGPGAETVTLHARLDSASVTGAYRFVVSPGVETTVDVTARLFFRSDVEQLGIAPLTSMYLFGDANRSRFNDYRPRVHDSNGLRILREDGDVIWRALDNPRTLATSYFAETRPRRFGLHQRGRDFGDYQDATARYDLRPSVDVEPLGDWGSGMVRLFELPTDLEIHDNIGAFWVPGEPIRAGDFREFAYRLYWGRLDPDFRDDRAIVVATRSGIGGASGLDTPPDSQKFVVDFRGGMLGRLPAGDSKVKPVVTVSNGTADLTVLEKLPDGETWRLVVDLSSEPGALVELTAHVAGYGQKLSEIWSYQWVRS